MYFRKIFKEVYETISMLVPHKNYNMIRKVALYYTQKKYFVNTIKNNRSINEI